MTLTHTQNSWIDRLARIGLVAKGIVYLALGALAFMAAFELAGHNENETNRQGVFQWLKETGGSTLLLVIAAGLACYCVWRFAQAFTDNGQPKKWPERARYFFSGLCYASVAITAATLALHKSNDNGDENQYWAAELLSKPMGTILVGIGALILLAIGLYQVYYGFSRKYKKHVQGMGLHGRTSDLLLKAGKTGYIARGLVWIIISYLMGRAAFYKNASEAGDTSKAFQFVEQGSYGSYVLGAIGIGLIAYGIFSFVRARYERF